jgi:restriction endonuclease S subunit
VRAVGVGDIRDDRLAPGQVGTIKIEQNAKTEKHLLQPEDVLVTARSTVVKAALVPPALSPRAVADATLLVVRPLAPGLGPYLWWFLTSASGREQVRARMLGSTTLLFLSATSLADVEVPLPPSGRLYLLGDLIHASERAYDAAVEAARLRRETFRDAIIERLRAAAKGGGAGHSSPPGER